MGTRRILLIGMSLFFIVMFVACGGGGPQPQQHTVIVKEQPKGAEAVHPELRDFVRQVANENGVSEEQARQAIKKNFEKYYSKQDVERHYGK